MKISFIYLLAIPIYWFSCKSYRIAIPFRPSIKARNIISRVKQTIYT